MQWTSLSATHDRQFRVYGLGFRAYSVDDVCDAVAACRLPSAGSQDGRIENEAEPEAAVAQFQAALEGLQQTLTDTTHPRRPTDGESLNLTEFKG